MTRTRLILAVAAALVPLSATAQNTDRSWSWTGDVGTDKWVRIASLNGPVVVEPSSDGRVHVTAEKRWRRGDPARVRIEVVESGGDVTVCALWHENSSCGPNGVRGGRSNRNDRNDVEVHFRVALPAHANVAPTTVNGGIKVTGAQRQVKATTVNGGIEVGTQGGPVSATTVNGSISARVRMLGQGLKFTTVNGGIDVALPRDASANIKLSTVNGGISSDFPITIQGRWGPRSATGTLGSGGVPLEMTSVNGSLALKTL